MGSAVKIKQITCDMFEISDNAYIIYIYTKNANGNGHMLVSFPHFNGSNILHLKLHLK